ncbi:MAG: pha synthase subunit protein [Xanthomonadaceae bacterium]|nr:pha synthase subunit protein [Xanthomonadaceae bacterium]
MAHADALSGSDFERLARQSWDAWQGWMKGGATSGAVPTAAASSEAAERALAGLKGYFSLLETLWAGAPDAASAGDWRGWMSGVFAGPGQPFAQAFADTSGMAGGGPDAWLAEARRVAEPLLEGLRKDINLPTFGLAREHQERGQRLLQALTDLQQQMAQYHALLARAGRLAAERLEAKLAAHAEPGRQIDSLRALYDLWVDAAEDAFQEVALSPEYRSVYGALVNAQSRVRHESQAQTEVLVREMGLPTRGEVATLGQRLHEVRRTLRVQGELAHEVAALRIELEALKRGRAAAPMPATTPESVVSKPAVAAGKLKAGVRAPAPAAGKSKAVVSAPAAAAGKPRPTVRAPVPASTPKPGAGKRRPARKNP